MRAFLEQYGVAIFTIIIISIMVLMANGTGNYIESLLKNEIEQVATKGGQQTDIVFNKNNKNEVTYAMLDSTDLVSGGNDVIFRSEADLEKFEEVKIDGIIIPSSNYIVSEGSTIIRLKKEYVETLSNGQKNIEIVSNDGSAKADFTVDKSKKITFTIDGTSYTGTEGMDWAEWILSYGVGSTGNGIVWVGFDNSTIYYDIDYPNHIIAKPGVLDVIYLAEGNVMSEKQTVGSTIKNNATYLTQSYYDSNICCFDAGSQVLMADGTTKNIENVVVGDKVMSLNEETGKFIQQTVKNTIIKENSDDLVYINLSDGTQIGMRAYHPLLTTEGWKSLRPEIAETQVEVGHVEMLEVGDVLVGYDKNVTIKSIVERPDVENYNTYNLSIEGHHNYIVNGVVVHNASCPE